MWYVTEYFVEIIRSDHVSKQMSAASKVKAPAKMSSSVAGAIAGGYDAATRRAAAAMHSNSAANSEYKAKTMTTRRELGDPNDDGEFDVDFQEGDLGLRLEERGEYLLCKLNG